MDLRLSVGLTCCRAMEEADPAQCASGMPDALCSLLNQQVCTKAAGTSKQSEFQGYVGGLWNKQVSSKDVEVNDVAAADSRDSSGTLDYTRNDTAGTVIDPGTVNFTQPLAPNGTTDDAEEMEAQTLQSRILRIWQPCQRPAKPMRAEDQGLLDGTKKNRNLLASLQFTFCTSSASATRRFGAGDVAGGRRAADVHRD